MASRALLPCVVTLAACTAPAPEAKLNEISLHLDAGVRGMRDDIMTPSRMRISMVLIGSGLEVGHLQCDFDWNGELDRQLREHCTSNVEFELRPRGSTIWLSHTEESLQVVIETAAKPTHARLDVTYEGGEPEPPYEDYVLSDIHGFGPLPWVGDRAELACRSRVITSTARSGELRCLPAAADQR